MNIPKDLRYTKEHEWVKADGATLKVGITDYAQSELGDVVFVEIPEVGKTVSQGESFTSVESVKAVSDVYAPISGKIVAVNTALDGSPEAINQDPYGSGWLIEIEPADKSQVTKLMADNEYHDFISSISK